jgi:hypothetical protein
VKKIENHCVCCDIPCIDCGRKHVTVYYCDECGEEIYDDVYDDGEQDLCESCLLKKYRKDV